MCFLEFDWFAHWGGGGVIVRAVLCLVGLSSKEKKKGGKKSVCFFVLFFSFEDGLARSMAVWLVIAFCAYT